MQSLSRLALAAALSVATMSAQAALEARPGGMVYDTVQNITWLADWNSAQTSGHTGAGVDANGTMTWHAATAWANNLVHGGFDDWRLPTSLNADGTGPCSGFNCAGSEMGHMFYTEFGATAFQSILAGSNAANLALFTNVQSNVYWSGTDYAPIPGYAWLFLTVGGSQGNAAKVNSSLYAVAVRPGDVAAIPEPQTYAMLLAGLGAVGVAVRRRRPR